MDGWELNAPATWANQFRADESPFCPGIHRPSATLSTC